ncbi:MULTISPECIES: GLPGLI family protein [unclassified Sphingobacterium]|uniref:GLPGLI family protein n=1 Tax=unclassified Sphingobacterium TaxID=2609468 RepID=UPI0025FB82BB|nr:MULTISPECIES: GLPGLI family protein [unclassified Sphingobacterium]
MHKYYIFFFVLFLSRLSFAQRIHAVYEYIPSAMATFKENVYYDGMVKIAVRDSTPQQMQLLDNDVDDEVTPSFSITIGSGKRFSRVVMHQNNANQQLETRSIQGVNYLVTDKFPVLVWNTAYDDVDTLGNYVCHKATASYRGTTLVAYYTNTIPVPVGPSKFGGLPGLIVMLYNESANPNYWYLKEVNYPYNGSIPIDYKYIHSLSKLTLEEFVKKEDQFNEEHMRMLYSKMPMMEGVSVEKQKVRGSVEQKYEWENQ